MSKNKGTRKKRVRNNIKTQKKPKNNREKVQASRYATVKKNQEFSNMMAVLYGYF